MGNDPVLKITGTSSSTYFPFIDSKYLENKFSVFNETDPIISKLLDSMN
jgi:hypothetical protein